MSPFLGRRDCIDSLRRDVVDLQGAILDVFSRTGPVRRSSWKFPHRLSCHLDLVALLDQYVFVDGDDVFNQHSHVVLLELVIDRLLLLLQSFSVYVEQLRDGHRRERTQQKGCVSVGLVVRHYWSNLTELVNLTGACKDLKKDTQTEAPDCDETAPSTDPRLSASGYSCSQGTSSEGSFNLCPETCECLVPCSLTSSTPCSCHKPQSSDSHNVSCQTVESLLVPCDACRQVQSVLWQTGGTMVELFQSEGLPSSLQPLLAAVEDTVELGHMTAADVAQWGKEQSRDMRRLAKHLQDVRGTVQPLTDRLAAAETERDQFRSQIERIQEDQKQEMQEHQTTICRLELLLQEAQRSTEETEQQLQEEKLHHQRETMSMAESISRLKEKAAAQHEALQALECENSTLQEKVKTLQKEQEASRHGQEKLQHLESQICETQLRLDKEKAKYNSACRQQESVLAKQKSLVERVDALDEECEDLQRQLGEKEEKEVNLCNQLQQLSEDKGRLQGELSQQHALCWELQKEKQMLETHVGELKKSMAELKEYLQILKERERILVAFPELHPQARPQTTGNALLDMEHQQQANRIRIRVLEQNAKLHSSVLKLRERTQHAASNEPSLQQTPCLSLSANQVDKQQKHMTPVQSPVQGGTVPRFDSLLSDGSEDRLSTAASSPSSLKVHLQTLHLGTDCTKGCTKAQGSAPLPRPRGFNHRRK